MNARLHTTSGNEIDTIFHIPKCPRYFARLWTILSHADAIAGLLTLAVILKRLMGTLGGRRGD